MVCDLLAHWSADVCDLVRRLLVLIRGSALFVVLSAFWSPSEVEAYRDEWAAEVRRG